MKIYLVLKSSYAENSGIELNTACVCASEEKAHEVIDNAREDLLAQGYEEFDSSIALAMTNPDNEQEYCYYEIQEMEVKANA